MALELTKGYMTGAVFTATTASWFFENPYWNNDGNQDFTIRIVNTGTTEEMIGGLQFTFLVANSGGQSFQAASGTAHTASGNSCTMTCILEGSSASSVIEGSTTSNIVYSSTPGQSYFEPRPGPNHTFTFNNAVAIAGGGTLYVKFRAVFNNERGGENCIQISSSDTIIVDPPAPINNKVWRYNRADKKWEKVLIPKIKTTAGWQDITNVRIYKNGSWQEYM